MRLFCFECNIVFYEWVIVWSVFIDGGWWFGEMKCLKIDCIVRMLYYNR